MVDISQREVGVDKEIFLVSVPHPIGVNIVWTCVNDHIINESSNTKLLDYVGLIINYLRKRRVGVCS